MSEHIDNSTERRERLKSVINKLHAGESVEDVKGEFADLLRDVGAGDIAELEQALIADGMPEEEIKQLCDVHVAVFRDSLDAEAKPEAIPGHPVHTFLAENAAAGEVLDALQAAIEASDWDEARQCLAKLREYENHYLREENILFPYLEKHGFTGPSTVMWAIHDDVRAGWKELGRLLEGEPDGSRVAEAFAPLAVAIREMFYKEEKILYPSSLERLSQAEWLAIRDQEAGVGFCYVEPGAEWPPEDVAARLGTLLGQAEAVGEGRLPLKTGALTVQEINWMLSHLPVDVTYIDGDDAVRFFSEGHERIFPRSPAIIGRKVQQCHPPASVDRVQQILDDFRAGKRDVAEFWIQRDGQFIHIRYFAVRDDGGAYQGTVEVSQDVTGIRGLQGERRLLDDG
ncbi:MAG: DUF438 domain-containing protein, partial [Anaerolineales bacterium]